MRILVFGGHGFIGSHTANALLEAGHEVSVAGYHLVEPFNQLNKDIESHIGDVRDIDFLKELIHRVQPEVIYHFASLQGYTAKPSLFIDINVTGMWKLFEAIESWPKWRTLKRFILASSEAVYRPRARRIESDPKDPPSVYGKSKVFQEASALFSCNKLKIPMIAMRYAIVLGPGQSLQSSESGILRNWYHSWKQGVPAEIYGDGEQERGFVHVADVVRANLAVLSDTVEESPYNISGTHAEIKDVAKIFQKLTRCAFETLNRDVRPGGEYTLYMECNRAKDSFGWEPQKTLVEMVGDFLESAKSNG